MHKSDSNTLNVRQRSQSSSSNENHIVRKAVTAIVEPIPGQQLATSKTSRNIKCRIRARHIDFDAIEICKPTEIPKTTKRSPINLTRTLTVLNQNVPNKINAKKDTAKLIQGSKRKRSQDLSSRKQVKFKENNEEKALMENMMEEVLSSYRNNVTSLLNSIRPPVHPCLLNLYNTLIRLNKTLSEYFNKQ